MLEIKFDPRTTINRQCAGCQKEIGQNPAMECFAAFDLYLCDECFIARQKSEVFFNLEVKWQGSKGEPKTVDAAVETYRLNKVTKKTGRYNA